MLGILVVLQEFDAEVSGGVALADAVICLQILLDMFDAVFYLMSMVDVDMAIVRIGVLLALIELDDGIEELVHASTVGKDGRNHGESEELAELVVVDVVATFLSLVKHVEGAHHADVHVYQLGGEVEIALQIAGVDDVDDDIWSVLHELLAHIEFLWRIC